MNMKQNLQQNQNKANQEKNAEKVEKEVAEAPVAESKKEQNKVQEELEHWKDLALRTAAEMENLKKRTQIDIEKANRYATTNFAKEFNYSMPSNNEENQPREIIIKKQNNK